MPQRFVLRPQQWLPPGFATAAIALAALFCGPFSPGVPAVRAQGASRGGVAPVSPPAVRPPPTPPSAATTGGASPATDGNAARRPIRFTFWNVQWFPGRYPVSRPGQRESHIAAVVPIVQRLDPDVLGLEEVGEEAGARLIVDQLPGFRLDTVSGFVREETGEPSRQQLVLASRLPLINAWWEHWKPGPDGSRPTRGFAFAAYQPTPGQVLLVYCLHLKSNRKDKDGSDAGNIPQREESARQLLAHQQAMTAAYAKLGEVTVVVGGDMNTSLDDARFLRETTLRNWQKAGFQWAFASLPYPQRITLPGEGRYPDTCFDHIFFRAATPRATPTLRSVEVERTGRDASDHRPVSMVLELEKRG